MEPLAVPDGLLSVSVYSPVSLRTASLTVRIALSGVVCNREPGAEFRPYPHRTPNTTQSKWYQSA